MSGRLAGPLVAAACTVAVLGWVSACGGGSTDPGPTRPPPPPPPPPPANRAPEAIGTVAAREVVAGTAVTLDLSPYFRDPDGDALTYAAESGDAAVATAAVAGVELTLTGVGPGSATLTIEARDPGGLSATQTASVTVLAPNQPPVVADTLSAQEVIAGSAVTLDLAPYFTDPDGDALTYAAASSDEAVATVAVAGAELTLTGVAPGSATFTIEARDPDGLTAAQTADVTVLAPNQPPVVADTVPAQEVIAGSAVTLDLAPYFTDPDGDALTYAAASGDEAVATVAVAGAELTLTGVAPGSATLTIEARDPDGLTAAQTADVTVLAPNQPPVVADAIPPLEILPGDFSRVGLTPYFTDPDGDALEYFAVSSDETVAIASVLGAELTVVGQAEGTTTVTVTASDPDGLSVAQEIGVNVEHRETYRFRADFDEEQLGSGWLLQDLSASITDGILRLEVTVPGGLGFATTLLQTPITEVEATTRVAFGDTENTAVLLLLWTSNPATTLMALDIGSGVQVNGRDTNYRFRVLDESGGEEGGVWRFLRGASGVSEAVPDVAGEFVDLGFSVKNGRLRARIGDAELFDIEWPFSFSPLAQALSVGAYPPEEFATGGIGLFDWVEVTGRTKGAGSRATEPDRRLELPRGK